LVIRMNVIGIVCCFPDGLSPYINLSCYTIET
jgi:hypothetical protein